MHVMDVPWQASPGALQIVGNAAGHHLSTAAMWLSCTALASTASRHKAADLADSSPTPCLLSQQAKNILIAVGGRAFKAPIEGAEHAITSDEILVIPKVCALLFCREHSLQHLAFGPRASHDLHRDASRPTKGWLQEQQSLLRLCCQLQVQCRKAHQEDAS